MHEGDKTNLVNESSRDGGADPNVDGSASADAPTSAWKRKCQAPRGMTLIVLVSVIFSAAVTIALILTIIFGEPQVQKLGAVAADTTEASQCGLEMLSNGGSAVDAAVAAALCCSVVQYPVTGLGAGGLMLVHDHRSDKTVLLDFLVAAPGNATPGMMESGAGGGVVIGAARSTGVPGFVRGLGEAHRRFGRLKWPSLFAPAIRLATKGFPVSPDLNRLIAANAPRLASNTLLKKWYLTDTDSAKPAGTLVTMPELAVALATLRDQGAQAMYTGALATEFLAAAGANGAWLTPGDMAAYRVMERSPLVGHYRNYTLRTFPPPAVGGAYTLLVAQVLAGYPEVSSPGGNATSLLYHRAAEAMKLALGAVAPLGDAPASAADLASPAYADRIRARIQDGRVLNATHSVAYSPDPWPPSVPVASSQLVAVDNDEMYVSMETGLHSPFGAGVTTLPGGLLLNNALAGFAAGSAGGGNHSNAAGPGRRPATLMSPGFAFNPRQRCGLRFAYGASNSTGVPGTAAWLVSRMSDLSTDPSVCPSAVSSRRRDAGRQPCLPARAAVTSPRVSPRLPAGLAPPQLETEAGLSSGVRDFLGELGHRMQVAEAGLGRAQLVAMDMYSLAAQSDSVRSGGAKAAMLPSSGV